MTPRRFPVLAGALLLLAACGAPADNEAGSLKATTKGKVEVDPDRRRNPAQDPGAVLIPPVRNANMVFDEARRGIVDRQTGEALFSRMTDNIQRYVEFWLQDPDGRLLRHYGAYLVTLPDPERGQIWAYDVRRVKDGMPGRLLEADEDDLRRFAQFVNADTRLAGAGHLLVIDNRAHWHGREAER